MLAAKYRVPKWHPETGRWRLRIGFYFNRKGVREERTFWWPGQRGDGTPPPQIVALAVAEQDQWHEIKANWSKTRQKLSAVRPEIDWTMPVWFDASLLDQYEAGAKAVFDDAVQRVVDEQDEQAERDTESAARWFLQNGLSVLLERLSRPIRYEDDPEYHPGFHTAGNRLFETQRATALSELRPHAKRQMIKPVTIREAIVASLTPISKRTRFKTDRRIEPETALSARKNLCAFFGVSCSEKMEVVRNTGVDIESPLHSFDKIQVGALADFWHDMPDGISSTRTIRNYLHAARRFFRFCESQDDYGWTIARDVLEEYTASKVDTPAMPYEPEKLRKILRDGSAQLQMIALFGLMMGYYQKDCTKIRDTEYYRDKKQHYIKRLRSKEPKTKQGQEPVAVRHWVAPELNAIIDSERGVNPSGFLFNCQLGTPLTVPGISSLWRRACDTADVHLPFKQLRKIGYNAIKRLSGQLDVAELWSGHSGGIRDAYDDGIFEPVNDAERRWRAELRSDGVL